MAFVMTEKRQQGAQRDFRHVNIKGTMTMIGGSNTLSLIDNLLRDAEPGPQPLFGRGLHDDSRTQLFDESNCAALHVQ